MTKLLLMYSNEPPTRDHLQRLRALDRDLDVRVATSDETARAWGSDAEVILGHRYLRQTLPVARHLRWVQSTAAGIDHLLCPELFSREPIVTRCPIFSDVIAWHALTLALALLRRLPEAVRAQQEGRWAPPFEMLPMPRTAMVIGLGCIGTELALLLRRQGWRVLGVVNRPRPLDGVCDEVVPVARWRTYLPQVDLCFLAIPARPDNQHFVDDAALAALPRHAVLVNVGRGSTLDTAALLHHLRQGHLGGAALDVLDPVPSAADDPIWSTPRLLLTPKVAVYVPDRQQRLEQFIESQVRRYLAGEPLSYPVSYQSLHGQPKEMRP